MSNTTSGTQGGIKKVYLIRHAESDENRRFGSLRKCLKTISKLSLPEQEDIKTSLELLNVQAQLDSNVSDVGQRQIDHMGQILKENSFLSEKNVQLVVHSPLQRARLTSHGLLGCMTPDDKAEEVGRVEETALLAERTPAECIPVNYKGFLTRIARFEQWLGEQPETIIAVVGHSQYFRTMLRLPFKFGNCDVWEVDYDPSKNETSIDVQCMKETPVGDSRTWDMQTLFPKSGPPSTEEDIDVAGAELPKHWSGLGRVHECDVKPEDPSW